MPKPTAPELTMITSTPSFLRASIPEQIWEILSARISPFPADSRPVPNLITTRLIS